MAEPSNPAIKSTADKVRERVARFRIVVIGRANAGKTTLLQRICNTTDKPIIFKPVGYIKEDGQKETKMEEVDMSVVDPTEEVM
jgi:GTPase SAR1 family protein